LQIRAKIENVHTHGISAVAFSAAGDRLISVGCDADHKIHAFDWEKQTAVTQGSAGRNHVYWISSHYADDSVFATCGHNQISFWTIQPPSPSPAASSSSPSSSSNQGLLTLSQHSVCMPSESSLVLQPVVSCLTDTHSIYGSVTGYLYVFNQDTLSATIRAHEGPVLALCCVDTTGTIVSGGRDGLIKVWCERVDAEHAGHEFECAWEHSLGVSIRAMDVCQRAGQSFCAVLTSEGNVVEILLNEAEHRTETLVCGQSATVHAVACSSLATLHNDPQGQIAPNSSMDVVWMGGEDRHVRGFDAVSGRCVSDVLMGQSVTALCSGNDYLFVGLQDGSVSFYSVSISSTGKSAVSFDSSHALSLVLRWNSVDGRERISALQYASNMAAAASFDNYIYVYDAASGALLAKCRGHSAPIKSLDISCDGAYLRSVCMEQEMLFWTTVDGKQAEASRIMHDFSIVWATETCDCSEASKQYELCCWSRNHSCSLVAAADVPSHVIRVFEYPYGGKAAPCTELRGHNQRVLSLAWDLHDRYLISCGGIEQCVFQWSVVPKPASSVAES
jgi:microtubule-associated protein-like 6